VSHPATDLRPRFRRTRALALGAWWALHGVVAAWACAAAWFDAWTWARWPLIAGTVAALALGIVVQRRRW
jgi:hypothetical protein